MPATFFLAMPTLGERGTSADSRSRTERNDGSGYSGRLSFNGGFDQYGFVPQRAYSDAGAPAVGEPAHLQPA
jgi:hypothetical protein